MPKTCKTCNRPKDKGHICDVVKLSDGRVVHADRVEIGGDLRESLGDKLKVVHRNITPELRRALKDRGKA